MAEIDDWNKQFREREEVARVARRSVKRMPRPLASASRMPLLVSSIGSRLCTVANQRSSNMPAVRDHMTMWRSV